MNPADPGFGWRGRIARLLLSDAERRQPDAVRVELLHVLYGRPAHLVFKGVAGVFCGLYAYLRQSEAPALGLGLLALALVLIRCRIIVTFRSRYSGAGLIGDGPGHHHDGWHDGWHEHDDWYASFGVLAIGAALAWGVLTFYCLVAARDPVLYSLVLTGAVATAGAVSARNAAAPRIAMLQSMAILLPAMAGAPLTGNQAYDFLLLLIPALLWGFSILTSDINRQLVQSIRSQIKLATLSNIDYLTQIGNRRHFGASSADAVARCRTARQPLAILMIDVDYFKSYNDHYGHQAGDVCLQRVASLLRENLRHDGDVVSRYGGEEFAVSLPNADSDEAARVAQRLCAAVAAAELVHAWRPDRLGVITVSVGTVATDRLHVGLEALVHAADRALYQAKHGGRNRVAVAEAFTDAPA